MALLNGGNLAGIRTVQPLPFGVTATGTRAMRNLSTALLLTLAVGLGGCKTDTYKCTTDPSGGGPCKKNGEWMKPYFKAFHKGDAIPDGLEKAVEKYSSRPVVYKFTFGSDALLAQTEGKNTVYCMAQESCFTITVAPKDGDTKNPYTVRGTIIGGNNMEWVFKVKDEQRAIFKELTHAQ